jgi:hypothetical protein
MLSCGVWDESIAPCVHVQFYFQSLSAFHYHQYKVNGSIKALLHYKPSLAIESLNAMQLEIRSS